MLTESSRIENYTLDFIKKNFSTLRVDNALGSVMDLGVKIVGGINEIVDTLGVNEWLEGEG